MLSEQQRLKLVEQIYEAVLRPETWATFVADLSVALHGPAINFMIDVPGPGRVGYVAHIGLNPEALATYASYFVTIDPFAPLLSTLPEGYCGAGDEILGRQEMERSEFYNDWMAPQGLVFPSIATFLLRDDDTGPTLAAFSSRNGHALNRDDVDLLCLLTPHLQRAVQMRRRMQSLEAHARTADDVLDRLPTGVILLDRRCRLQRVNHRAAEILRQNDGLRLHRGELQPADSNDAITLRQLIGAASKTPSAVGSPPGGGSIAVRRASGRRAFALLVVPLARSTSELWRVDAAVAIFLTDPESQPRTDQEVLRHLYDLTNAEARLAALLARGESLQAAAEQIGVSTETVRNQLKSIFAKTDTRRQGQLIHLLVAGPAAIRTTPVGAAAPVSPTAPEASGAAIPRRSGRSGEKRKEV